MQQISVPKAVTGRPDTEVSENVPPPNTIPESITDVEQFSNGVNPLLIPIPRFGTGNCASN